MTDRYKQQFSGFEMLYRNFYQKAFHFTKSYVFDDLIAEDIVSEALIKLWEQIRREDVRKPDALLLTIIRNKALDHLRHERIREEAFNEIRNNYKEELGMRISMLEACNPEDIFTAEIQQIVKDTLATFPEQTRLIFEMSRFEYKSNKEIAEKLGFTIKNIEYHISKVLKALKISLKDYLPLFYFFFFFK
jgi:RNA polymerase sigma-70 factor (ECF subfamily)